MVDKVKGGVKRGCVHFDTPSFCLKKKPTYILKVIKLIFFILTLLSFNNLMRK